MQPQTQLNNFNNYPLVDIYSNYMMLFSRSLKMKTGYQLITTKYHMSYSFMNIDFSNFSRNLSLIGITNEILIYRILSAEKYSLLTESEKKLQVFHSPELLHLQFVIQTLSVNDLFEMSFFHNYILKCSEIELSRNIIFVVEDIRYLDLLVTLKSHDIIISGGSYKYQHCLSPTRFRLSQIISCIENGRQRGVNNSYHLPKKLDYFNGHLIESTKPLLNWKAIKTPKQ